MNVSLFLIWLGRTSWQASVLVVIVLTAQWFFRRRLSARWQYALWLLVVVRLAMPSLPTSSWSVFNVVRFAPTPGVHQRIVSGVARPVISLPVSTAGVEEPSRPGSVERINVEPPGATSRIISDKERRIRNAAIVWLAGLFLLGGRVIGQNIIFMRRLRSAKTVTDAEMLALFARCQHIMGISKPLHLAETDQVKSPALYGFFRPTLLLLRGVMGQFSPAQQRHIFLHELAHVKRRDMAVHWAATVFRLMHWFNPVLWFGFQRMAADRELACDELALTSAGENEVRPYGETVLKLLALCARPAVLPGVMGILEEKSQMTRRILMIARYKQQARWPVLALVLVAGLGLVTLTDARSEKPKSSAVGGVHLTNSEPAMAAVSDTTPPTRPIETNGPTLKVTILDGQTGQPVPGAEVLAPNQTAFWGGTEHSPRWTTDKNGMTIVHLGVPPADHLALQTWFTMSIRHEGYAPRGFSWVAENKDVRPSMPGELTVRLERGVTAGGIVRDEQGAPIAGIHVQIHGTSYWSGLRHEYPEFWADWRDSPSATTDSQGRWQVKDFPRDLDYVVIKLSWPDGSDQPFTTSPPTDGVDPFKYQNPGEPFNVADLRADKLALILKAGTTVHGVVRDPTGRPLAGVPVKAGFDMDNATRLRDARTDAAGRFEFGHFLHRQLIVTACPGDYAETTLIIDANSNATPARLQVVPLQPLRMRVEDGQGRPLAGASIAVDGFRSEGQVLDFSAKTDHDGIAVWTNAPVSTFAMTAFSPDNGARQKIRLTPGQREITFKLRKGMNKELIVNAQAHDAETGAAVPLDSIQFQTADREGFSGESARVGLALQLAIAAARFRPGGTYPEFQLQARAKGYATLYSPWRDFDEGDWSPDFAFQLAHRPGQVVLLPDGSPAAGARVWSHFEQGERLFINMPGQYYGDRLAQTRADADGSFELPAEADDAAVLFTDMGGLLQTTVGEIKHRPTVRLQAFGRVQGVFKIAGLPRPGVSVNLASLYRSSTGALNVLYGTTTASDGSFDFSDVPAGNYKLYRFRHDQPSGRITEDHQMPITVKAGEAVKVQYSNTGRQIIGQAVSENPYLDVDWLNDDHTLTLKQAPLPPVSLNDFANAKNFGEARDMAADSPEQLRQMREARTYVLEFDPDGSFHAEDIPPGTYELRIHVTKPGKNRTWNPFRNPDDDLGMIEREVAVPPGGGPFDLGKLIVKIKDTALPEKRAAADFKGHALDGHAVSLAQYRGKYVLLTFWATWVHRCTEQLENVRKLEEQLSRDDRIAFLGVSLDEDPKTVRQAVESRGYKWTQANLDFPTLGKAAGNFEVSSLPAIYLIDTKGRVVASNLEGDRLRATVQRELRN